LNRIQQTIFTTVEEATGFAQYKDWKLESERVLNHVEEVEKTNSLLELEIIVLKGQVEESNYPHPRLKLYSRFVDEE